MGFNERSTIQQALLDWAVADGWEYVKGEDVPRLDNTEVLVGPWVVEAVERLNADVAGDDNAINAIVSEVKAAVLSAGFDGIVKANELVTTMLRGVRTFKHVDTGRHEPRHFIDFENPDNNRFVVSDEVTIGVPGSARRFDVVYFVNGFPLVVIETKNPVAKKTTWFTGAHDIHDVYEVEFPTYFAPNLLVAATDGLEFRYGAVRQHVDDWNMWGDLDSAPDLAGPARVELTAKTLLTRQMVLDILKDFALYSHATSATQNDFKILPRYPQVQAANAIHDKVLSGRPGGLIWHHQGTGKTILAAFAALKLLNDDEVKNPTVLIVVDRTQLVSQTAAQFKTTGMPRLHTPESKRELHKLLKRDERGVIVTTIHKFAEAGFLNDRSNIIVLVDEAHRTQEGTLGTQMRAALPNARWFGMTGTPVSAKDRNTFRLFGDPDDADFVMSRYEPIRSIVDGTTVPVVVEPRLVNFNLDDDTIDEAFAELASEEELDEESQAFLAAKAGHISTIMSNPERVRTVCADMVDHYLTHVHPLGQKAQVVAYNRELVVAYANQIQAELDARGMDLQVELNMSVYPGKDEKPEYAQYLMTEQDEEAQKARFCDINNPLSFIVVTSKLMTGFDAPIEGVLYLDKPLKAQNLFQTITRPNRTWRNPITKQKKSRGLVVDYIGLAKAIGKALVDPTVDDGKQQQVTDVSGLAAEFARAISDLVALFPGINFLDTSFDSLSKAHQALQNPATKEKFVAGFTAIQTIWEFLAPHPVLDMMKPQYTWMAQVYQSIQPETVSRDILWERLGAKTLGLVHEHMTEIRVTDAGRKKITLDAAGLALVKAVAEQGTLPGLPTPDADNAITLEDVMDTVEKRITARLEGGSVSAVYTSLAAQIKRLREQAQKNADQSIKFLEMALEIAQQVVKAERMEDDGELDGNEHLFDPNVGALTQIVKENLPKDLHVTVEQVVTDIDTIVKQVAFAGWTESEPGDKAVRKELRKVLRKHGIPVGGTVFDKAYAYIRENY